MEHQEQHGMHQEGQHQGHHDMGHQQAQPERRPVWWMRSPQKYIISIALIVLIVGGVGYGMGFFGGGSIGAGGVPIGTDGEPLSEAEIATLVERASKHIRITESEVPLTATVVDAESLIAEQPFYAGVENGDVVLIFQSTARAIIYSPQRDIVVNVGPVIPGEGVTQ